MKRKIPKKTRVRTAILSLVIAVSFIIFFFLLQTDKAILFFNEIMIIALLIILIPSSILDIINQSWVDAIDDQIPILAKGISESQETGVIFIRALEKVVENKMVRPPLSEEIEKLTIQISWGASLEEAIIKFKNRINSPAVNRFVALILETSRSGGRLKKVFAATSLFMEELRDMEKETNSQMRPYIIIIYAAFFVFIFTSIILVTSFFIPLEGYESILSPIAIVGVNEFIDFFYRTMLVSAVTGGLMAGKMGGRRIAGGLKHSVIQLVAGYLIFFFMIPPNWMVI